MSSSKVNRDYVVKYYMLSSTNEDGKSGYTYLKTNHFSSEEDMSSFIDLLCKDVNFIRVKSIQSKKELNL